MNTIEIRVGYIGLMVALAGCGVAVDPAQLRQVESAALGAQRPTGSAAGSSGGILFADAGTGTPPLDAGPSGYAGAGGSGSAGYGGSYGGYPAPSDDAGGFAGSGSFPGDDGGTGPVYYPGDDGGTVYTSDGGFATGGAGGSSAGGAGTAGGGYGAADASVPSGAGSAGGAGGAGGVAGGGVGDADHPHHRHHAHHARHAWRVREFIQRWKQLFEARPDAPKPRDR